MQLHVDTDVEPIAGLMLLSRFFIDYANLKSQQEKSLEESYPEHNHQLAAYAEGLKTHEHHAGQFGTPDARATGALPELAADFTVSAEPDPAVIFGKFPVPAGATLTRTETATVGDVSHSVSNVVSFPQPVLNLPGATGPAVMAVPSVASGLPVPPVTAPVIQHESVPSLPANNAVGSSADVDSQGIPWDERIHSSSHKKKSDGTWNLKRGVDHALAQALTAELIAAKLPNQGPVPVALPSPPVPLPPAVQASAVPVPPLASPAPAHGAPVPVSVSSSAPGMPIPPAPAAGAVPVPDVNPVKRFGAMMAKISQALGARTITQAQVLQAHKDFGLEQLQQAVLNPDKIPLIETALGLA